jgi:hypothetical protein
LDASRKGLLFLLPTMTRCHAVLGHLCRADSWHSRDALRRWGRSVGRQRLAHARHLRWFLLLAHLNLFPLHSGSFVYFVAGPSHARYFAATGIRRPMPNAFEVTFSPGGA